MDLATAQQRIAELEKANRVLSKQLARSEINRAQTEVQQEKSEAFLKQVIADLQTSQQTLQERSQSLEQALSELKAMQAKLVAAEKMSSLGTMVAGVAHEINNPINFIHGNLAHVSCYSQDLLHLIRLYRQEYTQPSRLIQDAIQAIDLPFLEQDFKKILQSMWNGTDRVRDIVRSLRTFARLDEAVYKTINLHDSLASTLMLLQNRLQPKNNPQAQILVIQDYGEIPNLECYAGDLNQVIFQLINNAIDAIEERFTLPVENLVPTIRIQTQATQETIILCISDNGCGMDTATSSNIFDPFFTTKPVGKGTGLGLAISYQIIVEQHKGQISCCSTIGEGSEFVIELPIKHEAANSP